MNPLVIYEDKAMMVLNKPSGMTVNRSDTTGNQQTLQDWIEMYLSLPEVVQSDKTLPDRNSFRERAGIVHRLDKETSGVILVAKTEQAFYELQRQFKERLVAKKYVALVHGDVKPSEGEINVPIGRQEWNRMRFGVVAGGKEAITHYKVIEVRKFLKGKEIVSFIELEPKTGRTHQIRVHMKYLGYPLFADFLYAGRKTQRDDRKYLSRVFLHAAKIQFLHPESSDLLTYESELPEELHGFLMEFTSIIR